MQAESLAAFLKTRLTKKLKRLSSGCSGFDSAIGVVDEVKLSTNGPAASCGLPCSNRTVACCAARCRLRRWCHRIFPRPMRKAATSKQEEFPQRFGVRASRRCAIVAAPPS